MPLPRSKSRLSRRFPSFVDAHGLRVTVHVTKVGVVKFRSQSNRKKTIPLSRLWHALVSPDRFLEAAENAEKAARRLSEARHLAFGSEEGVL